MLSPGGNCLESIIALPPRGHSVLQVEVLSEGDFVNDLHIVVSGTVEAFKYGSLASIDDEEIGSTAAMDNQLLSKRIVSAGEPFGEVAFFTEISQPEVCPGTVVHLAISMVAVLSASLKEMKALARYYQSAFLSTTGYHSMSVQPAFLCPSHVALCMTVHFFNPNPVVAHASHP